MKTVIVTGATGFVGAQLVRELASHGITVYAICRPNSPHIYRINKIKHVNLVFCEMIQLELVFEIIPKELNIDVLYHTAWDGIDSTDREIFQRQVQNIVWCGKIVELANHVGCRKIIVAGTVYEQMSELTRASNRYHTSSFYFLSKDSSHRLLSQYCYQMSIKLIWCQFLQPIGVEMRKSQLVPFVIRALLKGESPILGMCNQPFDMLAVEDLAYAFYLAGVTSLPSKCYYIGSGTPRILRDYLLLIRDIIAPSVELQFGNRPDDGMRFEWSWFSIEAFSRATGFTTKIPFEKSVSCLEQTIIIDL